MSHSRSQSPLRPKASIARLLGIRRPGAEAPHTRTTERSNVRSEGQTSSPADDVLGHFAGLLPPHGSGTRSQQSPMDHDQAFTSASTSHRYRPIVTNRHSASRRNSSIRSSSSSDLWGSPVTEEAVALGLVKRPTQDPCSSDERHSTVPIESEAISPATSPELIRSQSRQGSPMAAQLTQLRPPTSKTLKRILKSSVGLKKLMAEQQQGQLRQGSGPQDVTDGNARNVDHMWESMPDLVSPELQHRADDRHGACNASQRWSPPTPSQTAHSTASQPHRRAPLTVIGLAEEISERESREEAAFHAKMVAKCAQAGPPVVTQQFGHHQRDDSGTTFTSAHGSSSSHPYGFFNSYTPVTTPSDELPGWTGYAHYVRSSIDEKDSERCGAVVATADDLRPFEPSDSLLFRPIEAHSGGTDGSPYGTRTTKTPAREDTFPGGVKPTQYAGRDGGHPGFQGLMQGCCSDHEAGYIARGTEKEPFGSHYDLNSSSWAIADLPVPSPASSLPKPIRVGPSTTQFTEALSSTPFSTPVLSLTPTSPSFPTTPITPAREQDDGGTAPPLAAKHHREPVAKNPLDQPPKQRQRKVRGEGRVKKVPTFGSLALASTWPKPPHRASSIMRGSEQESFGQSSDARLATCAEDRAGESETDVFLAASAARNQAAVSHDGAQAQQHPTALVGIAPSSSGDASGFFGSDVAQRSETQHNRCVSHTWDEETEVRQETQ